MNVQIRPWQPGDEAELLRTHDPEAEDARRVAGTPSTSPQSYRQSLVAVSGEDLVGIGTVWSAALHPDRLRLSVYVTPERRREGIGTRVVSHLIEGLPADETREVRMGFFADNEAAAGFARALSFEPLMQTALGTIAPEALDDVIAQTSVDASLPAGTEVLSGATILNDPKLRSYVASLHGTIYHQHHQWSLPATLSVQEMDELFLAPDDVHPDALFVAMQHGVPLAVASLRPGKEAGHGELGWAGAAISLGEAGYGIVMHLVERSLRYAQAEGLDVIYEIDEADEFLARWRDRLGLEPERTWLTVRRPQRLGW